MIQAAETVKIDREQRNESFGSKRLVNRFAQPLSQCHPVGQTRQAIVVKYLMQLIFGELELRDQRLCDGDLPGKSCRNYFQ